MFIWGVADENKKVSKEINPFGLPPCLSWAESVLWWGGGQWGLSPHPDWFYWQPIAEDADVARRVRLDKDGSAHNIIGKAVLFSISLGRRRWRTGTTSGVGQIHAASYICRRRFIGGLAGVTTPVLPRIKWCGRVLWQEHRNVWPTQTWQVQKSTSDC